jgi:hypothetical protein
MAASTCKVRRSRACSRSKKGCATWARLGEWRGGFYEPLAGVEQA